MQAAHAHHVAALLVVGIDMEQVVGDVFHDGLDEFTRKMINGRGGVGDGGLIHEVFHQDAVAREQGRAPAESRGEGDFGVLHRQ